MDRVAKVYDAHGIRWQVRSAYAPIFLAAQTPDPRRLLRSSTKHIIKRSDARIIFASSLASAEGELPVVIKIYRHAKIGDWLKANLLGSKARREWAITNAAVERGLNTVIPVAYGERRRLGILRESYLLTVRLFDCVTLEEILFSEDGTLRAGAAARREIIVLLARLLRRMHDSGIYHRDLHPGNFLVETSASGGRRLYLLDLHRASARKSLGISQRIRSLAQFNMFASISLGKSERLLFFNAYFGDDRPWRDRKRALLKTLDARTRAMRWRLWRRREYRCLSSNKYFLRLRCGGYNGFAARSEWRGEMAQLLLSPETVRDGGTLIKESRSKALWEKEMVIRGNRYDLFIKQYKKRRGWWGLTYLWRPSKALRSWKGAYALLIRRINCVHAIAAMEERLSGRRLGNAYFISYKLGGVDNLNRAAGYTAASRKTAPGEMSEMIRGLALFLRKIHDLGVFHGDMKATNILVQRKSGGGFTFYLSDLDFLRTRLRLPRRCAARNLSQINASMRDLSTVGLWERRRFLLEYLGPARRGELRGWWRSISRRTGRKLRRSGRRFTGSAKAGSSPGGVEVKCR